MLEVSVFWAKHIKYNIIMKFDEVQNIGPMGAQRATVVGVLDHYEEGR